MITGEWLNEQHSEIYAEYKSSIRPFTPAIIYDELADRINAEIKRQFDREQKKLLAGFSWKEESDEKSL